MAEATEPLSNNAFGQLGSAADTSNEVVEHSSNAEGVSNNVDTNSSHVSGVSNCGAATTEKGRREEVSEDSDDDS
jgi:hypothetical protein